MQYDLKNKLESYNMIIVYGAGKIGSFTVKWLKKNFENKEIKVAITDKYANKQICEHIESQCISDLAEYSESAAVLIATQPIFQGTMRRIAEEYGFKEIIIIDDKLYSLIRKSVTPIKNHILGTVKLFPQKLINMLFRFVPLQNTIVFSTHTGCQDGSCDTVYRYMDEKKLTKKYKVVWIVNNPEQYTDTTYCKYISSKKMSSFKNRMYLATSKYIVWENIAVLKSRDSQKSIHITHGMPTIKNVHGLINIPEETDAVLISSENVIDLQAYQMCMDKRKYVICGLPRIDDMFGNSHELSKLNISNKKTIIWMPTFRKLSYSSREDSKVNSATGIPLLNSNDDIHKLNAELRKRELNLIIKIHPLQDMSLINIYDCSNISVLTNDIIHKKNINFYGLLGETSALISDYSSVAFDYLMTDMPMAFILDDMNEYRRGFAIENVYDFMPGEKIFSFDDLITFLDNIADGVDDYVVQRENLKNYCHKYQDAKNAERFWNALMQL